MFTRGAWLSITPEPERELPEVVAVLSAGRAVDADAIVRERDRLQAIVLRRGQRRWLTYLRQVIGLIELRADATDPAVTRARRVAHLVITNHHNLLLGLSGAGASLTTQDRARLAELGPIPKGRP